MKGIVALVGIVAAISAVMYLQFGLTDVRNVEVRDFVPAAECVAEQSYTHPDADKFAELVNALRLCDLR